jgi:hypothetical protein
MDAKFLRRCKQGVLQFVVIKLLMAATSIFLLAIDEYDARGYWWFRTIVYNVSYTWALYVLFLFYKATSGLLADFRPVRKFIAVKAVVFLTFWQTLTIQNWPTHVTLEDGIWWNDFILCLEMVVFAVLHCSAFPYGEFRSGVPDRTVLGSMGEVLSVRDVVRDTVHSFKPSYQEYVLTSGTDAADNGVVGASDGDASRTFKTTTFLVGNLGNFEDSSSGAAPEMVKMQMKVSSKSMDDDVNVSISSSSDDDDADTTR